MVQGFKALAAPNSTTHMAQWTLNALNLVDGSGVIGNDTPTHIYSLRGVYTFSHGIVDTTTGTPRPVLLGLGMTTLRQNVTEADLPQYMGKADAFDIWPLRFWKLTVINMLDSRSPGSFIRIPFHIPRIHVPEKGQVFWVIAAKTMGGTTPYLPQNNFEFGYAARFRYVSPKEA